jgi:hypothetical protein
MKKPLKNILIAICFLDITIAHAENDKDHLVTLMQQDSTDINTLASYPDSTRNYIFEAATEPKALNETGDLQKKTNAKFKDLVSSYSKSDQQKIWNLTRYDNLVSQLADGGKKSKEQAEEILKDYPAEAHDDALNFEMNHPELLANISNVNKYFSESFENIIKDYPAEKQTAFRELVKLPEVITVLNNNRQMTQELGDIYKSDPGIVKQQFDSLNADLSQMRDTDTQAWQDTLKNNPDAMNELQQSAKDYAKEKGYNENDYSETNPEQVQNYVYYPYPLWAGYPSWYTYDYWYPYPYWYDWGFYFHRGNVVFLGCPSWHFMYWHFHHYPHFYRYPHLTNAYFNYYYGPRKRHTFNAIIIHNWVRDNKQSLPKGFLRKDYERVDRIKELGKMEMAHEQYNKANPSQQVKREDFIAQHVQEYPHLRPVSSATPRNQNSAPQHATPRQQTSPVYQPPVHQHEQNIPVKPQHRQTPQGRNPRQSQDYTPAQKQMDQPVRQLRQVQQQHMQQSSRPRTIYRDMPPPARNFSAPHQRQVNQPERRK